MARLKLVIVHYHFRPGGVRRVIELATPDLLRELGDGDEDSIMLIGGEARDVRWNAALRERMNPTTLEIVVEPAFKYFSEQRTSLRIMSRRICETLKAILSSNHGEACVVWAHNLGLGRNAILGRELVRACAARDVPLVLHHHDWWFENRWARWPEMRRSGVHSLGDVARLIFPARRQIRHAAINRVDASILRRHLGERAAWLPNPVERVTPPADRQVRRARTWLRNQIRDDAPVWLLPCRLLRRKNIAEALLLTRWLRPDAWLVTTGGVSSDDERYYGRALSRAASHHGWRLRLGVMSGGEKGKPTVAELLAASEAVLLTSLVEGFGLPYVEAAAAQKPLIARLLPNVAPDLRQLGFRFPQSYAEVQVHPDLFDWPRELARQASLFARWKSTLPRSCRALAGDPRVLATRKRPQPVAFSRLTLSAQLEVIARPVAESWDLCAPLNPFLCGWRRRAEVRELQVSQWPHKASALLNGAAYARRFARLLRSGRGLRALPPVRARATQARFVRERLSAAHLFPLLWAERT